jgi:TonB family protein
VEESIHMRRVGSLIVFAALFAALFTRSSTPQTQTKSHTEERKIVSRVAPFYPEMAKRMNLSGVVKLEVLVSPSGKVKSAKAVGGSPVLIQAATDAVEKWRFEAATEETTEVVQIAFQAPH